MINLPREEMKCHYTYVVENGKKKKYLIPGCYPVGESNDIRDCICRNDYSFEEFAKKRYNDKLEELIDIIKELEDENKRLMGVIKQIK